MSDAVSSAVPNSSLQQCYSDGGVVTLGGVDPAYYTGKLTCVPVNERDKGLWLIKMERVSIGNGENDSPFCPGSCETSIDSGCSYLIGPPDEVTLKIRRHLCTKYHQLGECRNISHCQYCKNVTVDVPQAVRLSLFQF